MCAAENCRGATYFGYCQNVLSCYNKGLGPAMRSSTSAHADMWRAMRNRFGNTVSQRIAAVCKVKAHQDLETVINTEGDIQNYWGNYHADKFAKNGAELQNAEEADVAAYKSTKKVLLNWQSTLSTRWPSSA